MSRSAAYRRAGAAGVTALLVTTAACGGSTPKKATGPLTVAGATVTQDAKLHDALPDAIKSSGVVRVATDVPYPPFEMFATEGGKQITGLDYDLGQALGARL